MKKVLWILILILCLTCLGLAIWASIEHRLTWLYYNEGKPLEQWIENWDIKKWDYVTMGTLIGFLLSGVGLVPLWFILWDD